MQDKLEDVLPHVPVSHGMERLLGEVMEDMARDEKTNKSTLPAESSSVAANNSTVAVSDPGIKSASPVTKPGSLMMSTDTIEIDKSGHWDRQAMIMLGRLQKDRGH